MRKYKFIAVEGIDGVGKSTVAKTLATVLAARYEATPFKSQKAIYSRIEALEDRRTRYLYFLMCNSFLSKSIEHKIKDSHVVADRYIYSTICYHAAMWSKEKVFDIARTLDIRIPDIVVYLYIKNEDVRWRRLQKRAISVEDYKYRRLCKNINANFNMVFAKNPNVIKIDNTITSKDELRELAVNKVLQLLNSDKKDSINLKPF